MNTLLFYIYIYVIGGVTFIPLLLISLIWFLSWYLPQAIDTKTESNDKSELDEFGVTHPEINYEDLKSGEFDERLSSGVETYATGWLTVTTEFYQLSQYNAQKDTSNNHNENNTNEEVEEKSNSPYSQIYKFVKGDKNGSKESHPEPDNTKSLKNVRKKNRYFAVLKHGNLFLYKDDDCKNVQHVIVLNNSVVSLWPRNLKEGELFSKRTAICIMKKEFTSSTSKKTSFEILTDKDPQPDQEPPRGSFFIYSDYNHEKEDWYFNLIKATKRTYLKKDNEEDLLESSIYARTSFFKTKNMIELIQTLNSSEGQLTTKWLNALIGRVFLGLHNTKEFHDFVKSKVEKKLIKIKKPGFLDDFQIQKINVGDSGPFITFPKLKQLSPEGDLDLEANLLYQGGLSIQIATKANINLGSRFKTREVNLVLTVKLVKLSGQLLVRIKPPPSNRIWYSFTSMPDIDLEIEPVVSARQLTYNVVTKMIGNKFKEAIRESLVMPYMDEFPIYNTEGEIFRGGIWDKLARSKKKIQRSETLANDELVGDEEEEEQEQSSEGEEEYEGYKPPQKSGTFPIIAGEQKLENGAATAFSKIRHSSSFSSSTRFGGDSPDKPDSASSLNDISTTTTPPLAVPRNVIPQVMESDNPSQIHQTENVYVDKSSLEPSDNSSTSKISKQMKKVFKNKNGSSESINSSTSSLDKSMPLQTQNISSSIKKLGKWYNKLKDNRGVEEVPDQVLSREPSYVPPEMIRYRREKQQLQRKPPPPSPSASSTSSVAVEPAAPVEDQPSPLMFQKKPSHEDFMALPKSPPVLPPRDPPPSLPPRNNSITSQPEATVIETRHPGMIQHRRSRSIISANNQSLNSEDPV